MCAPAVPCKDIPVLTPWLSWQGDRGHSVSLAVPQGWDRSQASPAPPSSGVLLQ